MREALLQAVEEALQQEIAEQRDEDHHEYLAIQPDPAGRILNEAVRLSIQSFKRTPPVTVGDVMTRADEQVASLYRRENRRRMRDHLTADCGIGVVRQSRSNITVAVAGQALKWIPRGQTLPCSPRKSPVPFFDSAPSRSPCCFSAPAIAAGDAAAASAFLRGWSRALPERRHARCDHSTQECPAAGQQDALRQHALLSPRFRTVSCLPSRSPCARR